VKYNLSQKYFSKFRVAAERASYKFHWGEDIYHVETTTGFISMLRSPRGATLSEVKDIANKVWGSDSKVILTKNKEVANRRRNRVMIGRRYLNC